MNNKEYDDDLYVIEIREGLKWIKQESIFTAQWRAQEVCEKLGLKRSDYRIKRYKKKYRCKTSQK